MKLYKSVFTEPSGRGCLGCGNTATKAYVSNGYNYYCTCTNAKLFAEKLTHDPVAILDWPGEVYQKPIKEAPPAKPSLFAKKPNDGDKGDLPW